MKKEGNIMDKKIVKKIQMGIISLSALAVLTACGDGGTQDDAPAQDEPTTEEPAPSPENEASQNGATGEDTADEVQDEGQDQSQDAGTSDTASGIYNREFQVSLDDATQMFYDMFGEDATIDQIEFDEDDGVYEYNIDGWDQENEYELDINADTGDIIEENTESDSDQDDTLELEGIISPQEAMDIAVEEAGSEIVEDWTLEVDNGVTVYEVNFENADDDDIVIDAASGDIIPD